jgi:hypothetical protein
VDCYAVAGTRSPEGTERLASDGLVPVASALGHHPRPELELGFPADHCLIVYGAGHLDLLAHERVAQALMEWLRGV